MTTFTTVEIIVISLVVVGAVIILGIALTAVLGVAYCQFHLLKKD